MIKPRKWNHLSKILTRNGPFVQADFDCTTALDILKDMRILVIGAGGLGCELLKCLSLMGFVDIHVIDCDTIELSNLNRQFLFRTKDIGRSKAVVAAEFINNRVSGCQVIAHDCKIEDKDKDFYYQFNIIVVGLDAIEPRKWLNQTIFQLLEPSMDGDGLENIIPIVDGGTEGFKGNARVIIPSQNYPCIECTLDLYPPRITFPMCTLAQRPRLPEHCIEYVRLVLWTKDKPFGETPLDGDDPMHLQWVYERSLERSKEFGIDGVSYRLTQGVVKNIIPAVASTNSVIASACATEVFKLATASAPLLHNYMVFNDSCGIYTYTYEAEQKPDCSVCSNLPQNLSVSKLITLQQLIALLKERFNMESPSITTITASGMQTLYMKSLGAALEANLNRTLLELNLVNGQRLLAFDRNQNKNIILQFV
ncbi:NEDD8-activating protein uba3 [Blomia tropicalis]|nr:NEDD8-activating protein uba3 [Blomia tropicalis]